MWVDPSLVDPITPVLAMANLQNTIHLSDESTPLGLFRVGDASCHTDPVLALGLSFSLVHALEAARALRSHEDLRDAFGAYSAATMPALRERYDLATGLDEQRLRMWTGQLVDFAHRDGDYAIFSMVATGAAAMVDPGICRMFLRRIGLLDSTRVLDDDIALQEKIEGIFAEMMTAPRPAQGPAKDEMLALCRRAANGGAG